MDEHSVSYVVIRGVHLVERGGGGDVCVVVQPDDLPTATRAAEGLCLAPHPTRSGSVDAYVVGGGEVSPVHVNVTGSLRYGKRICIGEPAHRLIARGERRSGVAVATAADELLDLTLHCVIEAGEFSLQHRVRLEELMSELRRNPVQAGRAAVRVEQALAPALHWGDLLADIVQERWDRLLDRRSALVRKLRKHTPLLARMKRMSGTLRRRPWAASAFGAVVETTPNGLAEQVAHDSTPSRGDVVESRKGSDAMTRKQIRGSGLLLGGRALSGALKFAAELIVVRYLTTAQYGAWTYALAVVTFLRGLSALGLNRALSRYLPLHLERDESDRFYGVLIFVAASMLLAGALLVTAFYLFPIEITALAGVATTEPLALLFILIFLVPLETIDNGLTDVCAAFGDARTIFVRRFLLHPGLRLGAATLLVLTQADVKLLAYAYLLSAAVGVAYYAWSVLRSLQSRGLLKLDLMRGLRIPVRRVLCYTTPVMAADLCSIFMITAGPLLLGFYSDMSAVALYQVVVPVAALNTLVHQSFIMLFEPSAARLIARDDREGLLKLYRRFAVWVAVLTFPLFALSFTAAEPLVVTLFGVRYADAAPILSLLAVGHFADGMVGFNAATLRVSGQLKSLILVNAAAALVTVALGVAVIPWMGAGGAAVATMLGLVTYTVLKQMALRATTGVTLLDPTDVAPYLTMAAVFVGLVAVRVTWGGSLWITMSAVVAASLIVYSSARVSLSMSHTFPELARSQLLRTILG